MCLSFVCSTSLFCQLNTGKILSSEAFINQVKLYHPIASQANLLVEKATADLLSAKGAFDPSLQMNASRKTFDGSDYYHYNNPELVLPTPVGVNIKTGIENNSGNYVNPEVSLGGASYLGVEIPLARGLLLNKRRAVLMQAKIFKNQSEQEKLIILNDLLFEAYSRYWEWAGAYRLYNIYSDYVAAANRRLRLVRISFNNGDRAMADTLEAYTQLQNYQLQQSEALLRFNNASLELSNYFWEPGEESLSLPLQVLPDSLEFVTDQVPPSINELTEQAMRQNPLLKSYEFKLNSLQVERKLKARELLPVFNIKANLLNKDYFALKGLDAALLQNNYKWGFEFKLPLFLRESRGAYRLAKLKIKETDLQLSYTRRKIENKLQSYFMENNLLEKQLQTTESIYANYSSLLRNEELKFNQGESSLFLVNSREIKVLELLQKQVELRIKYFKSRYAIPWAAGLLR